MIDLENVLSIHEHILSKEQGLKGGVDLGKLESALNRITHWQVYENTENIFDIAALYAVAIAKAHAFLDGNKRTAILCANRILIENGAGIISIPVEKIS